MVKACGDTSLYYPGIYLIKSNSDPEAEIAIGEKPKVEIEGDHNKKILFENLQVSSIHSSISHED